MKKIYANNLTTLSLGRQGENLARQVVFDIRDLESLYGSGTVEVIHNRPGDAQPYPLAVQRDGTLVTWDVTATDTETDGYGKCELRYYAGETLAKSQIWRTWVESAMDTPSETAPPEPEQGWVDQVLAVGVSVKEATDSAKTYANSAEQYASGAAQSAQEAAGSASAASTSETNAKASEVSAQASQKAAAESASAAANSAASASASASAASESASAADASKTAAKSSEEAAKASETAAKASETAASESASAAQQSATSAAESAAVYDTVVADVTQLKEDVSSITKDINDPIDVIFMEGCVITVSKTGFNSVGGTGFYITNISQSNRITSYFSDIATQIPDYATWNEDTKTFTLTLSGEKSFGYNFETKKFEVGNYTVYKKPSTFATLYWRYYNQYGGKIFEYATCIEVNKSSLGKFEPEIEVVFMDNVMPTVSNSGFTITGSLGLYLTNTILGGRIISYFSDIATQIPDYATWNEDTKTFTLTLSGEKSFGYNTETNTWAVANYTRNKKPASFVTLYWTYYKQYGGKIFEYATCRKIADDKTVPITDSAMLEKSFNSAYHNGASGFKDVCQRFSALMSGDAINGVEAVDECESFLFFTDPHLVIDGTRMNKVFPEYMAQIQKYYNSTPTTFAVCGGDWLGNSDTPEMACYKMGYIDGVCKSMLDRCYMVVGNHDTNYQGKKDSTSNTYTTRLSRTAIRNLWYRDTKNAYYTFDGANTSFYVFDCGIESQTLTYDNNYGYEQAKWFAESLISDAHSHIAMIAHMYYNNGENVQPLSAQVLQIAEAYNTRASITVDGSVYDFASVTGRVEFMLVGHSHKDFNLTANGIPVIGTLDAGNGQTYPTDASLDLVFVDYDNRKINLVRAGTGSDREIALDS